MFRVHTLEGTTLRSYSFPNKKAAIEWYELMLMISNERPIRLINSHGRVTRIDDCLTLGEFMAKRLLEANSERK